jgi:hypothetical protein
MVSRFISTSLFVLSMLAVGWSNPASVRCCADEVAQKSAVLLKNGNVVQGVVREGVGWIIIDQSETDRLRVPTSEVSCWAPDVRGLYDFKRDRRGADDLPGLLRDIRWCIHNELFDLAAEELIRAARISPDHPELESLEKFLRRSHESAMRGDRLPRKDNDRSSTAPKPQERRDTLVIAAPESRPDLSGSAAEDAPSDEDPSDPLVTNEAAISGFAKEVQPLLLNGCAASGCHGAYAENPLRLIRPLNGQMASARISGLNLQSVLPYLDRQRPGQSPLLTYRGPGHSDRMKSVTADRRLEARIVAWIRRFAPPPDIAGAAGKPADEPPAIQRVSNEVEATADRSTPTTSPASVRAKPKPLPAVEDPFDPEIFNRRFHAPRIAGEGQPSPGG